MRRLGIVVMYDINGIAYDYLLYYLKDLKVVCDKLILAVNGSIQKESQKKCNDIVDGVYVRNNENLDIGAYIDTIHNYLSYEECITYDEIVLANDTLFGPFKSFNDIFYDMGKIECDVWGLNINTVNFSNHIQSYFYCFRNQSIIDALEYWENVKLPDSFTRNMFIGAYELGLSNYLVSKGKVLAAYSKKNHFDAFSMPQFLLKYCNFPFLKKSVGSCILNKEFIECNYMECVDYIKGNSNYPIEYITRYLKEKFGIDVGLIRKTLNIRSAVNKATECKKFVDEFNKIYLYGMGQYGQMIFGMLGNNRVEGFIVSSPEHEDEYCGKKIYCIQEVAEDSPILVALNEKNTCEVREHLVNYKNVCYLWE